MEHNSKETLILHFSDLCERCERQYSPQFTKFLTPEENVLLLEKAKSYPEIFAISFGGIKNSERNVIGVFPGDIYVCPKENSDEADSLFCENIEIGFVKIKGSGFRKFSHRDLLGSLMSLGLKREMLGDIIITEDEMCAYVAAFPSVVPYITENLTHVANDKVKVSEAGAHELPKKEQRFKDLSVTLSSLRLDAVLSAVLNLSREKVKKIIASGLVCVNHTPCERNDREINEGDIITVRGYGKFLAEATLGLSGRGRIKVVLRKYL